MSTRFRPCIDLHDGKVKQIVGGTLSDRGPGPATNFVAGEPPEYFAELYRRDDLPGGHVIQLGPGNREAAERALRAWPGGLHLGGGVNADNAAGWLEAGAGKVIVTSYVFADGELKLENLERLRRAVGRERLVLDLSCRPFDGEYFVMTDRWQKRSAVKLSPETFRFLDGYASEYLIHAVAAEGLRRGIDRELVRLLAATVKLPCVYAGGIASLADIDLIDELGAGRIDYTVGSALDIFGGDLPYRELLRRQPPEPAR